MVPYSRKIKKNGLFYYRRKILMAKWAKERDERMQGTQCVQIKLTNLEAGKNSSSLLKEYHPSSSESSSIENKMPVESDTNASTTDSEIISDNFENLSTSDALRQWALLTYQSHASIELLLKILKPRMKDCALPRSGRTLLKTDASKVVVEKLGSGEYWFNGLEKCIKTLFTKLDKDLFISININIDGLPVHKSSRTQLWPILFNVVDMPDLQPMPIAIYCGSSKPSDVKAFLQPFVEELSKILSNGVKMKDYTIFVKLRCFICDSPARSFIKGVSNFNSIHGCQKCTCEGQFSFLSRTVTFPFVPSSLCIDSNFRENKYGLHHKCTTPFIYIPEIDIIKDIVVGDRLHLIDLGVTKRLLSGWRDGKLENNSKWRSSDKDEISEALQNVKFPQEIHRRSRGLDILPFWKASEFANFLHYSSITILNKFFPKENYDHFLLYFCTVIIFSCDAYKHFWHIAREMMSLFVSRYATLYGEHLITSNVHNLLHVADECEKFGNLNTISAYPFENALQQMKKLIRSGNKSLQQVVKRLSEISHPCYFRRPHAQATEPHLKRRGNRVWLTIRNFTLSNSQNNAWFMLHDQSIVKFNDVIGGDNGNRKVLGFICQKKRQLFPVPIHIIDFEHI